jgi:hypothetical protein
MCKTNQQPPAFPEPDVWWGESGIDALLWAEDQPYAWSPRCKRGVDSQASQDHTAVPDTRQVLRCPR